MLFWLPLSFHIKTSRRHGQGQESQCLFASTHPRHTPKFSQEARQWFSQGSYEERKGCWAPSVPICTHDPSGEESQVSARVSSSPSPTQVTVSNILACIIIFLKYISFLPFTSNALQKASLCFFKKKKFLPFSSQQRSQHQGKWGCDCPIAE